MRKLEIGTEKYTTVYAVDDLSKISDGYHTIAELYDHRCLLWINFCLSHINTNLTSFNPFYLIKDHYEGWFLLGMLTTDGQISYHCPNKYLYLVVESISTTEPPIYDGHSPKDVCDRLLKMAESYL